MKLILSILITLTIFFSYAQTPQAPDGSIVAQHGHLQVSGSYVGNQHGQKISLAGNSLFWSLDDGSGGEFYTAETLNHLADEWNTSIVRAAMGVKEPFGPGGSDQGYLIDSLKEVSKVNAVVNAAIEKGIYVIIDWHSHYAHLEQAESIAFFEEMARLYGEYDNVIYEIFNEPKFINKESENNGVFLEWPAIKTYAEAVIQAIRNIDPDNLIVVGTGKYSQNVLRASRDKINDNNVAYTLHFYAGERDHDRLRGEGGEAKQAMDNGIAIFVTEWGSVPANGGTGVYSTETRAWMEFLKQNYISHANWSVSDKPGNEDHPIIIDNAGFSGLVNGQLTESGILVKDIIKNWNVTPVDIDPQEEGTTKFEAENAQLSGVNVVDEGSASGGQYVSSFTDNGDKIVFNNINAPSTGTYSLTIRYASSSFKENFIQVNNGSQQSLPFPESNVFSSIAYDVNLNQGNNTITIEKNWGWFDVDYIAIDGLDGEEPEQPEPEGTLTLEAENAELIGVNNANNGSASGGKYVTGFTDSGDKIIFNNVNASSTGTYPLTIRYACTSDKNNFVQINNGIKEDVFFPESTGFTDNTFDINLNQGSNTITIEKNWGWFDVDYIKIGGLGGGQNPGEPDPQPQGTITIEAESGALTAVAIQPETSASNGEYVTGFTDSGDKVAVTANITTAGMYQLNIGYRSNGGAKTNDLYLNGSFLQNVVFPQSSSFTEITAGDFYFEAGQSTIEFVKNWGWMDVDYFKLSPAENTDGNSSNNICDRILPINSNVTAEEYVGKIINSAATILSDNSTEFKAVEEINLNNEFTVEKGGNFSSKIEECTD